MASLWRPAPASASSCRETTRPECVLYSVARHGGSHTTLAITQRGERLLLSLVRATVVCAAQAASRNAVPGPRCDWLSPGGIVRGQCTLVARTRHPMSRVPFLSGCHTSRGGSRIEVSDASCAVRCDRAFPRACLNLTFGQPLALLDAVARKSSHAVVGFLRSTNKPDHDPTNVWPRPSLSCTRGR